jgi:hypothetical protein
VDAPTNFLPLPVRAGKPHALEQLRGGSVGGGGGGSARWGEMGHIRNGFLLHPESHLTLSCTPFTLGLHESRLGSKAQRTLRQNLSGCGRAVGFKWRSSTPNTLNVSFCRTTTGLVVSTASPSSRINSALQ